MCTEVFMFTSLHIRQTNYYKDGNFPTIVGKLLVLVWECYNIRKFVAYVKVNIKECNMPNQYPSYYIYDAAERCWKLGNVYWILLTNACEDREISKHWYF